MRRLLAQEEYRDLPTREGFTAIVNGLMDNALQVCRGATGHEIRQILVGLRMEHPILLRRIIQLFSLNLPENISGRPQRQAAMRALPLVPEEAGTEIEVQLQAHDNHNSQLYSFVCCFTLNVGCRWGLHSQGLSQLRDSCVEDNGLRSHEV